MSRARILVLCLAALLGLSLAGLVAFAQKYADHSGANGALQPVTQDRFAPPFSLIDQDGARTGAERFEGKYLLVYFGFTYCPAVCPTELSKMTAALNMLAPAQADAVRPVFVTVDPERDTPAKMKDYVSMFHPSLTGLTGSPDEIKQTLKDWKVYAAKAQDPTMSDYTMDHTSWIFLTAPDGRLLRIFKPEETAAEMAAGIGTWMKEGAVR